jgi:hypothetical protein
MSYLADICIQFRVEFLNIGTGRQALGQALNRREASAWSLNHKSLRIVELFGWHVGKIGRPSVMPAHSAGLHSCVLKAPKWYKWICRDLGLNMLGHHYMLFCCNASRPTRMTWKLGLLRPTYVKIQCKAKAACLLLPSPSLANLFHRHF